MAPTLRCALFSLLALLALLAPAAAAQQETVALPGWRALNGKLKGGEPVTVAFLGGSITVGATTFPKSGIDRDGAPYDYIGYDPDSSWRRLFLEGFERSEGTYIGQLREVHGAMGNTGSDLAAFRAGMHALDYQPDLLVIEFAVNDIERGTMSAADPFAPGSIHRTLKSLVEQARAAVPNVAVLIVVSTVRDAGADTAFHRQYADSRVSTLEAAAHLGVPVADVLGELVLSGHSPNEAFGGPETTGNRVHPSPDGHVLYAGVILREAREVLTAGQLTYLHRPDFPGLRPWPESGQLLLAPDLAARVGWSLVHNSESWATEPCLRPQKVLEVAGPQVVFETTFQGSSIGLWWEKRFGEEEQSGWVQVFVDDELKYQRVNEGHRRYVQLARYLDPDQVHTLRIVVPDQQAERLRLGVLGLTVD